MSRSTPPDTRFKDDEVDLLPLAQALWRHKVTVLAATVAGTVVSLLFLVASPDKWTASTYLSKPSLYDIYAEVTGRDGTSSTNQQPAESLLYKSIQNDVFYTAMGILASQYITVKETLPKAGRNESVLYIVSSTATTAEQASAQLISALDKANKRAITLNLPSLSAENGIKAFNQLDDEKVINDKKTKTLSILGALLGFILGCTLVIGRFLIKHYNSPTNTRTNPTKLADH